MDTDKSNLKNRLFVNKLPSSQVKSSSLNNKNQNEKIENPISISRKEDLSFLKKGISKTLIKIHGVEKIKKDIEQNKNKINNDIYNNEVNDNINNNNISPNKKMNLLKNNFITVQTSNSLSKNSPFYKSKSPLKIYR